MKQKLRKYDARVCYHEAGHAVAWCMLLGTLNKVKVWKQGRKTLGHCVPFHNDFSSFHDQSVICYAGAAAHARFSQCRMLTAVVQGGMEDYQCVETMFKHYSVERRQELHQVAETQAASLVRRNWDWIDQVACNLSQSGHLTGKEVWQLWVGTALS